MRRILLAAAFAILAAAPVRAQVSDTPAAHPDTTALRELIARVCPRTPVIVTVDARQRGPATCTALPDARLLVDLGDERLTPRLAEIEEVWVRQRNTARGAQAGAIVGAVTFGSAAGYLSFALCDAAECGGEIAPNAVLGALVGAAAGGLIGSAFGYVSKVWKRRYVASP